MGGGGGGWFRSRYHNWDEETWPAQQSRDAAAEHRRRTGTALNQIYTELDYEQTRIQTNAFAKELKALMDTKDIEWKIFEQEVKKAQANYIANLYTNRIVLELKNLEAIVDVK
jgi:hypothetical protein